MKEILKTASVGIGQPIRWNKKGKRGVGLRGLTLLTSVSCQKLTSG